MLWSGGSVRTFLHNLRIPVHGKIPTLKTVLPDPSPLKKKLGRLQKVGCFMIALTDALVSCGRERIEKAYHNFLVLEQWNC